MTDLTPIERWISRTVAARLALFAAVAQFGPHCEPGLLRACEEIGASHRWLVHGRTGSYPSGSREQMPILAAQIQSSAIAA